jgi:MFS family permease
MTAYSVVALALLNHTSFKGSKVLISLFALELGASQFLIGVLYAMYSVFPIVLAVYAGKLADRVGMRRPMLLGSVGLTLGLLIPYAVPSVLALFLSATFIGMFYIFFVVAMQSLIGALPGERATNYSIYSLGIAAASFIGPLEVGFSIDFQGHAATYLLIAVVPVVASLWLALDPRFAQGSRSATAKASRRPTFSMVQENETLRRLLIAGGVVEASIELYTFYMPIYGRSIGLSASQIGTIMSAYAAASMAIRFAMPVLVRRLGEAQSMRLSMFVAAGAYCLFPFVSAMTFLLILSFVLGLGMGCCSPLSMMLIHTHAPGGRAGEAQGLRQTVNKITESAAPVLFGALGSIIGMTPLFWGSSAMLFGGGALLRGRPRNDA